MKTEAAVVLSAAAALALWWWLSRRYMRCSPHSAGKQQQGAVPFTDWA